jgi:DNA-binding transcriptional ArsR family regulator
MIDKSYEAYGVFFETLANQNRLRIINALRQGEKNVTEIVKRTGLEQTCVSHCLARLERCGFVSAKRQGKYKAYSLNTETIEPLMGLIDSHTRKYCIHLIGGTGDGKNIRKGKQGGSAHEGHHPH